jgi:hypothetical protein
MTSHRHGFIALLLLVAIVCLLLTPLLTIHGKPSRHGVRADISAAASLVDFSESHPSFFLSSTSPERRSVRSEALFELHCARIC